MIINAQKLIEEKFPPADKEGTRNANINKFAKSIGVSYDSACKIYDGTTTRIYLSTIESMCDTLGCTPNDILLPTNKYE